MRGRIKKKQLADLEHQYESFSGTTDYLCQLCLRPTSKAQRDKHHLIPKSRGGVETVILHRLCHQQIHALLTETQLARDFSSIEALRAHPEIAKFIAWVSNKPANLRAPIRRSRDKGYGISE